MSIKFLPFNSLGFEAILSMTQNEIMTADKGDFFQG